MSLEEDVVRAKFARSLSEHGVEMRAGSSEDKLVNSIMEFLLPCLFLCFKGSWANISISHGMLFGFEYLHLNQLLQFLFWMGFYLPSPDSFLLWTVTFFAV